MKKSIILVLFIVLFCSLVSSSYICSDGSSIIRDKKEISKFNEKGVNGVGIAVIEAREHAVLRKFEAELVIDAEKVVLTNKTSPKEVEILIGRHKLSLINASDTNAKIQIDTTSKEVIEGEYKTIGNILVFLVNADGPETGEEKAEMIIGKEQINLDSETNPSQIFTINNTKYAIELFSASYSQAIVSVSNCKSGEIVGEVEEEEQVTENNEEEVEERNKTAEIVEGETNQTEVEGEKEKQKSILEKWWFWVIAILVILFIVYIILNRK